LAKEDGKNTRDNHMEIYLNYEVINRVLRLLPKNGFAKGEKVVIRV